MAQSEQIGELAKALAAAHAAIKPPSKGKTAKLGTYSYKYADLADVIESYREPLSKNGLAISQTMGLDDGTMVLATLLLHSSGQWLRSEYPIAAYAKPQEQGSAITYARRYAVTALLGIAAEDDDDGAAAQAGEAKPKAVEKATAPTTNGLTDADIEKVGSLAKRAGYKTPADIKPLIMAIGGAQTLRALDKRYLPELISNLERKAGEYEEIAAPANV